MIKRSALMMTLFIVTFSGFGQTNSIEKAGLQRLVENGAVGVVAGYSKDGEIKWANAVGYSDREQKTRFTDTTLMRIASIAKPMTAIAIMQLVEQGKIDLDAPIQTYIPTYPQKSKSPLTTRMFLTHTSGTDGYKSGKEAQNKTEYATLSDAMQVFQNRDLKFESGSDFGYTTYGYVVLGVVIERASGMSYEDYMQTYIWDVVGMEHTSIERSGETYTGKSALYHKRKKKAKRAERNNLSNRTPGGGFQTTVNDLLLFGHAILNHKLIQPSTFEMMIEIGFPVEEGNPYGMGWVLYGPKSLENAVIGHGGGQTGANSHMFIDLPSKIVTVVLSNTSGTGNDVVLLSVDLLNACRERYP